MVRGSYHFPLDMLCMHRTPSEFPHVHLSPPHFATLSDFHHSKNVGAFAETKVRAQPSPLR
jgi:hypothetical protein